MTGFQSPNHTQIPNDLFDKYLPDLGHAELKILLAILRQTLGFHRKKKRMSLTAIQKATGLARSSVQVGCDSLVETGLVNRVKDGRVTQWIVSWLEETPDMGVLEHETPTVPVNGIADELSQSIPEIGTDYTGKRYSTIPVKGTPSIKESIKERDKEKDSRSKTRTRQISIKDKVRKEAAEHFSSKTNLPIPILNTEAQKRKAGTLWFVPIREICEMGEWQLYKIKAIIDLSIKRLNGLTVSDPNSIIKTARAIVAEAGQGKGELRPKEVHEMSDKEFMAYLGS